MTFILDSLGRKINLDDVAIVDGFFKLKAESGSNPWPVIEKIITFWADKKPSEWRSFLYEIEETRESRADKEYGLSKGKTMRYTLDIPEYVQQVMRVIYSADELPMDREFFIEFAKRFPKMKVASKL
jgi:hypothetical protein